MAHFRGISSMAGVFYHTQFCQIYLPVMISANSTLSYLATFQLNCCGDAFWAFLPFSDLRALSSPFRRKLTAYTRFGFLEKVAFHV